MKIAARLKAYSPSPAVWLFAAALLALLCLFFALRDGSQRRLIDCLPTCKTTGVFIGLVELKGTAETRRPLHGYLSGRG